MADLRTDSTDGAPRRTLVVLVTMRAERDGPDGFIATTKQVEGAKAFAASWPGPVRIWMEPATEPTPDLDRAPMRFADLPYEQVIAPFDDDPARFLRDAAVVLCATSWRQNHIPALCQALGVPAVVSSEYTLRTRLAIVGVEEKNPVKRLKRSIWEARQELRQRRAIRAAQGLQANGTPTYDAYAGMVQHPHLYFDTRTERAMVLSDVDLEHRLAARRAPLRLCFSGRLAAMKGVQYLPAFATALKAAGVPFTLEIFGDGPLKSELERERGARGLEGHLFLRGVLPFSTGLVPHVKRNVDLYVIPHVQGDPSCTYLETFACGVPIVGFDNEAFAGILARQPAVGEACPIGNTEVLAHTVARWSGDPDRLARASRAALKFARDHTFEETFQRRVDHLRGVAGLLAS